jgi:protein-S-isoprenylcysteine O-methyltransferase Ste14/predicted DCC family thiol-disulfide oxidoreductase YuxK
MRDRAKREGSALALAAVWVAVAVLVIEQFRPTAVGRGAELAGVPLSHLGSRVLVWGVLPATLFGELPLWLAVISGLVEPDLLGIACALLPAQLFYRWTRDRTHLRARTVLHFIYYTAVLMWVLPAAVFELGAGSFAALGTLGPFDQILLQIVALPGVVGVAATLEFLDHGHGTPMPYDAPTRLVTTGPFAYVANPFQITKVLLVLGWGAFLGSGWLMAASAAILIYAVTLARANEDRAMSSRFGLAWQNYRENVRRWVPRWRPWRSSRLPAAELRFDGGCGQCRQVARWLGAARHLRLVPDAPEGGRPSRLVYVPGNGGPAEEGIAALARALEHVNLGWAFIGWSIRIPVARSLFQLIADVVTAAPDRSTTCRLRETV